jgi:hypothetical protein
MDGTEQRRSHRIRFSSKAILRYGENLSLEAHVDTRNISFHGLLLETDSRIPLNTPCGIEIHLTGTTSSMDLSAQGVIQRHDPSGMAVAFTSLHPDSYLHILNLIKLHEAI